jgi:thioredoxin 1
MNGNPAWNGGQSESLRQSNPMRNVLIVAAVVLVVVAVAWLKRGGSESRESTLSGPSGSSDGKGSGVATTRPAASLPRLLELGAGKCIPCKTMAPIIEEIRQEYAGRLAVESIDVMENQAKAREYNLRLIPCQIFLDPSGKELWRHEGVISKADILAKWEELGYGLTGSKAPTSMPADGSQRAGADERRANAGAAGTAAKDRAQLPPGSKLVAYYLHRTQRCQTCLVLEQISEQAIREGFGKELADGLIEFKSVNYEEPENAHFVQDFKLTTQSLVLVRLQDDRQTAWKALPRIWELVGVYGAFAGYVQGEVGSLIRGEGGADGASSQAGG